MEKMALRSVMATSIAGAAAPDIVLPKINILMTARIGFLVGSVTLFVEHKVEASLKGLKQCLTALVKALEITPMGYVIVPDTMQETYHDDDYKTIQKQTTI